MTDQQILEKAIQKAIDGVWRPWGEEAAEWKFINAHPRSFLSVYTTDHKSFDGMIETKWYVHEIIFNHDFAKALWGDEKRDDCSMCGYDAFYYKPLWQWHLARMVIAEDPIKYLGQNMP